mmetsp:Transcript_26208/g.45587  ORF Transcript_26208/g.45587 Transcript_26208/m.45587 type:complete len:213 (-) Transcript_26208:608-1246(-)
MLLIATELRPLLSNDLLELSWFKLALFATPHVAQKRAEGFGQTPLHGQRRSADLLHVGGRHVGTAGEELPKHRRVRQALQGRIHEACVAHIDQTAGAGNFTLAASALCPHQQWHRGHAFLLIIQQTLRFMLCKALTFHRDPLFLTWGMIIKGVVSNLHQHCHQLPVDRLNAPLLPLLAKPGIDLIVIPKIAPTPLGCAKLDFRFRPVLGEPR